MRTRRRVLAAAGHMIDKPHATPSRFPPSAERRVVAAIRAHLDRWQIGDGDLVLSQGACGADLIVAEEAIGRGAEVELLLAAPVEQFIESSVALPGTSWADRFHAVLGRSRVLIQAEEIGPPAAGDNRYRRNNCWALDRASDAGGDVLVLVVDSGQTPREGGSADFAQQATERGLAVTRIDPSRAFRYDKDEGGSLLRESRGDGPKRLLALDGGGMRGLISLQILKRMEQLIGNDDKDYRLSSTFDYFAGTSTGAMIAAALACGHAVDEIETMYGDLGPRIFRKRWLPGRLRSLYKAGGITDGLKEFFKEARLGDSSVRSLLAVVTHRADTDSLWPITNVSTARYNDRARGDCNLDFPLWQILRGSTAAPVFFPPERITMGPSGPPALFEDGGVTPFNNPALLLVELATSTRYTLDWPTGPDDLLLVSVGTGSSITPSSTNVKDLGLLFQARTLIRVIMNGSSTENDRLCQVLGHTRHAPRIDSEFNAGEVNDIQPRAPLFSYVRYNIAIGQKDLAGIPELSDISAKQVGRLDAASAEAIDQLKRIGGHAARQVKLAHFAGFLP